jgi:hypothetical protein
MADWLAVHHSISVSISTAQRIYTPELWTTNDRNHAETDRPLLHQHAVHAHENTSPSENEKEYSL